MADSFHLISGSTNGKGVKVTATATAGTTVHTAASGTTTFDLVTLWAQNNNSSGTTRTLTLEWGATSTDNNIIVSIPARTGLVLIADRLPIQNSLVVGAFADVANEVIIYGTIVTTAA